MKRILQTIGVRPDCFDAYCDLHDHIWPDVADAISRANLENYSIFHLNGNLYQYMEYTGTDLEADMAALAESEAMLRWCSICKTMQLPDTGVWSDAIEVFHLP